jgi:hypothetical protein
MEGVRSHICMRSLRKILPGQEHFINTHIASTGETFREAVIWWHSSRPMVIWHVPTRFRLLEDLGKYSPVTGVPTPECMILSGDCILRTPDIHSECAACSRRSHRARGQWRASQAMDRQIRISLRRCPRLMIGGTSTQICVTAHTLCREGRWIMPMLGAAS